MRKALVAAAVLAFAALLVVAWHFDPFGMRNDAMGAAAAEPYVVPPIGNSYASDVLGFSLGLPEGFIVQEFEEEDGVKTVVLQDSSGNGIQILATPIEEDIPHLSIERIRQDIPDMEISDVQPVEIGEGRTGVAFKSDNEAFGGASREVWFVFRGNLYQISTYARLDELLQSMFASWQFI